MLRLAVTLTVALATIQIASAEEKNKKEVPPVLNFKMKSLAGKDVDLGKYQGKVLLIVNVASFCGNTPQYKTLQALHEKYGEQGLAVLGFPCNQFGKQEPGTPAEIAAFCKKNYDVTFDLFEKVDVNGDGQCDLYKYLTSKETDPKFAGPVKWNFGKFLINRKGEIVARFAPGVKPDTDKVVQAIEANLSEK